MPEEETMAQTREVTLLPSGTRVCGYAPQKKRLLLLAEYYVDGSVVTSRISHAKHVKALRVTPKVAD